MLIEALETASLGNRSYVVVNDGEAIAIDPPRDVARVDEILRRHDARLRLVVETHRHADYVSGGQELARRDGTPYGVPADPQLRMEHVAVVDGLRLEAAGLVLRAMHTPGHTPFHMSYVLEEGGSPRAVFTGGSMLYGSVGRTDLVAPDLTGPLAHDQWHSVHRIAGELAGAVTVLPTHGFGSFCSASETTSTESDIERQRRENPALTQAEEEFVTALLAGYDAFPAYYAHVPSVNADRVADLDLGLPEELDAAELGRRIAAGEWVLDLRARRLFAREHVAGMVNFDSSESFAVHAGWLLPWDAALTLVGESREQVAAARLELARIGYERLTGIATGAPHDWVVDATLLRSYRRVTFDAVAKERPAVLLDVRRDAEWNAGHIASATHIPLHELLARMDEVPAGEVWVHCGRGFRASIAASLLERAGREVVAVDDDFANAGPAGNPIVRPGLTAVTS